MWLLDSGTTAASALRILAVYSSREPGFARQGVLLYRVGPDRAVRRKQQLQDSSCAGNLAERAQSCDHLKKRLHFLGRNQERLGETERAPGVPWFSLNPGLEVSCREPLLRAKGDTSNDEYRVAA